MTLEDIKNIVTYTFTFNFESQCVKPTFALNFTTITTPVMQYGRKYIQDFPLVAYNNILAN